MKKLKQPLISDISVKEWEKIKQEFNELVEQNYQAILARGLITDDTDFFDFMEKLHEETIEMAAEYGANNYITPAFEAEYIDSLSVLLNLGRHYKIDIIDGLKANAEKNWSRAKDIDINDLKS